MTRADFALGQRVKVKPCGAAVETFGKIVGRGRRYMHVKLDALTRPIRIHPSRILPAWSTERPVACAYREV
jgi:hypothetical protein